MPAGNFNSANFNDANFRTDLSPASPDGNYYSLQYSSLNFFTDDWLSVVITDSGAGVDIAYNPANLGSLSIDNVTFPHVTEVDVDSKTMFVVLQTPQALAVRRWQGATGRTLVVKGWTDNVLTLESLRAFADGKPHSIILPWGAGLSGLVTNVVATPTPNIYGVYPYELNLSEVGG